MKIEKLKEEMEKSKFILDLDTKIEDTTCWKVLKTIDLSNYSDLFSDCGSFAFFKTKKTAWIEEFKVGIVKCNNKFILILVSETCPDYVFVDNEIIESIKDSVVSSLGEHTTTGNLYDIINNGSGIHGGYKINGIITDSLDNTLYTYAPKSITTELKLDSPTTTVNVSNSCDNKN